MSLQLGPTEEQRSPLKFVLIATVVMIAILVTLYFTTWRKMAEATVVKSDVFAPHTVMNQIQGSVHVLGSAGEEEDNVYVVAHVRFVDKMNLPIFYSSATATMTDNTGATLDATVVSARQLPGLEQTFPQLTTLVATPFTDGDQFSPNTPREGTIVLLFPQINQAAWNAKKAANLTLEFAHQQPLTIPLP